MTQETPTSKRWARCTLPRNGNSPLDVAHGGEGKSPSTFSWGAALRSTPQVTRRIALDLDDDDSDLELVGGSAGSVAAQFTTGGSSSSTAPAKPCMADASPADADAAEQETPGVEDKSAKAKKRKDGLPDRPDSEDDM